jgi:hypothetical protein
MDALGRVRVDGFDLKPERSSPRLQDEATVTGDG